MLRDRTVVKPGRLVAIASIVGPLISSLLTVGPFFFGSLPATALEPLHLAVNVLLFGIGSYCFGLVPALLASVVLVLRRNITVLEAVVVALGVSFAVGTCYGMLGASDAPLIGGLSLTLLAIPATIGVGLLATWWGAFGTPSPAARPPILGDAAS